MTGGNIFHGALSWAVDNDDPLDTPARQGAATDHERSCCAARVPAGGAGVGHRRSQRRDGSAT